MCECWSTKDGTLEKWKASPTLARMLLVREGLFRFLAISTHISIKKWPKMSNSELKPEIEKVNDESQYRRL